MNVRYLILGAGPTGFGAAYRLKELGIDDFLLLEATDHPGGLASSYMDEKGFVWDVGGHVHFSHYARYDEAVDRVLGQEAFFYHQRNSQIWLKDRFIPYPFQANLHRLRFTDQVRALAGLVGTLFGDRAAPPADFRQWISRQFGGGIARLFMLPYNKKVWGYPPEILDVGWMGDRVASVNIAKIFLTTLLKKDQRSWGPNNEFRFPKRGGTGAIWQAMARHVEGKIRVKTEAVSLDSKSKTVATRDGRTFSYQTLISSIPLSALGELVQDLPAPVKDASQKLLYSSVHLVGIGINGRPPDFLKGIGWMYFPEPRIPFYRATVLSRYSRFNVPDPNNNWSLLMEMSASPSDATAFSGLLDKTIDALLNLRFVRSRDDILSTWTFKAHHGYPTPHLGRDALLKVIQPELERMGIYSRGRFGGWKYEVSNQDHCFMQGMELIDRLEKEIPEVTYPTPEVANRGMR